MLLLFYFHLVIALAVSLFFKNRLRLNFREWLTESFIYYWSAVVLSSLSLAAVFALNNDSLMILLPLVLFAGLFGLSGSLNKHLVPNEVLPEIKNTALSYIAIFSKAMLALVSLGLILLNFKSDLQIPDSLVIKLPNMYYYLKSGTLLPSWNLADEGRLFATPFNGTLILMQLQRFQQGPGWILGLNLFSWMLGIIILLEWCRDFKVDSRIAWILSASLFCTLGVASQAVLDCDDLISSITGVAAGLYLLRFFNRNLNFKDLLLFVLGFGLCFGAKGFSALYLPAFIVLFLYILSKHFLKAKSFVSRNPGMLLLFFVMFCLLALPFAYVQWKTTGHFTFNSQLQKPLANSPFNPSIAFQNGVIYNLQLLFSDFIDVLSFSGGTSRRIYFETLNPIAQKLIPSISATNSHGNGSNIFHLNILEIDTWFGMFPLFAFVFIFWATMKGKLPKHGAWFLIFFLFWDMFFASRTIYIEGLGRYWILPVFCLVPLAAGSAANLFKVSTISRRFSLGLLCLLALCSATVIFQAFSKNVVVLDRMYIPKALAREGRGEPKFSQNILNVFKNQAPVNIVNSSYGLPVYYFMRLQPTQTLRFLGPIQNDALNLIGLSATHLENSFDPRKSLALRANNSFEGGMSYLGRSGLNIAWFLYIPKALECINCSVTNDWLFLKVNTHSEKVGSKTINKISLGLHVPVESLELQVKSFNDAGKAQTLKEFSQLDNKAIEVPFDALHVCFEAKIKDSQLQFKRSCLPVKAKTPWMQDEEFMY